MPVPIDGKTVDLGLDTGASVTITPKSIWSYEVIPVTKLLLSQKLRLKLRIMIKKQYYWLLSQEMMVLC